MIKSDRVISYGSWLALGVVIGGYLAITSPVISPILLFFKVVAWCGFWGVLVTETTEAIVTRSKRLERGLLGIESEEKSKSLWNRIKNWRIRSSGDRRLEKLQVACENLDVEEVEKLLKKGAKIENIKVEFGIFGIKEGKKKPLLDEIISHAYNRSRVAQLFFVIMNHKEGIDCSKLDKKILEEFCESYIDDIFYNDNGEDRMKNNKSIIEKLAEKGADFGGCVKNILEYTVDLVRIGRVDPMEGKKDIARILLKNACNWPIENVPKDIATELIKYADYTPDELKELRKEFVIRDTTQINKVQFFADMFENFVKKMQIEIQELEESTDQDREIKMNKKRELVNAVKEIDYEDVRNKVIIDNIILNKNKEENKGIEK